MGVWGCGGVGVWRCGGVGVWRWLQRDPIGTAGGSNLYQYADADPLRLIDPMGLRAVENFEQAFEDCDGRRGVTQVTVDSVHGSSARLLYDDERAADQILSELTILSLELGRGEARRQSQAAEIARTAGMQVLFYPIGSDSLGAAVVGAKSISASIGSASAARSTAGGAVGGTKSGANPSAGPKGIYLTITTGSGQVEEVVFAGFQAVRDRKGNPVGPGTSYRSFDQLKKALPELPKEWVWHHVVEQCQQSPNRSGFTAAQIHSVGNVIAVPREVNSRLAGVYAALWPRSGVLLRNTMNGLSYDKQLAAGLNHLKQALREFHGQ
ncbi:MAG: hypothetical protein HRU70_10695 [Phycisphaeraceae bacterium]|nr:MAG: hypothetical protein HRU70_10695 [Phycisphaeraceae bacterium]